MDNEEQHAYLPLELSIRCASPGRTTCRRSEACGEVCPGNQVILAEMQAYKHIVIHRHREGAQSILGVHLSSLLVQLDGLLLLGIIQ